MTDGATPALEQLAADYDAVAVINLPKGGRELPIEHAVVADDRLANEWRRDELISMVAGEGVLTLVTRGSSYYDEVNGRARLMLPILDGEEPKVEVLPDQPLSAVGVVYTITTGALPLGSDSDRPPQFNAQSVRELSRERYASLEVLRQAGLHEGGVLLRPNLRYRGDQSSIDTLPGDRLLLRPNWGKAWTISQDRRRLEAYIRKSGEPVERVVEPIIDCTLPWPQELRGRTAEDTIHLREWERGQVPKMLRVHSFGNGSFYFTARKVVDKLKDEPDKWVFLDQQTIPEEARQAAVDAYEAIARVNQVKEMHLGIDLAFAPLGDSPEPRWRVAEFHAVDPLRARHQENAEVATEQDQLLANQIARIARQGSLN